MDKKEYIDRSELIKVIGTDTAPFTTSMVFRHIRNAPAADVVEVVHCKDCIYYRNKECESDDFWSARCGKQISIQGENLNFCPACGAAQTDEAVQMVMERLEALNNEG